MFSTMVIHANSMTRIQCNAWMILLPFNIVMLLNLRNPMQSSRFIGRGVVKFYRYSFSPSPTLIHDSLPNRPSAELLVYSKLAKYGRRHTSFSESGSWKRDIEVDFIVLIYYYRVIVRSRGWTSCKDSRTFDGKWMNEWILAPDGKTEVGPSVHSESSSTAAR